MNISYLPNPESISQGEWTRFIFIAGRLCIDFTQTGGETGKRAYWERFHQPTDLADWLAQSPLQLQDVQPGPEEFKIALALRESIWRVAQAIRHGETHLAEDIGTINRAAAAPDLHPQLNSESLEQTWGSPATATAALSVIARDAIDLFSGELRSRIRECANPNCGLMFVDASRPGKRRWCLMKRCGNMAKTSQYRKTKKRS
ncbi:MAG TPA: ABATE domain-containing protein [Anaerolineales bacterium]|nr:ABATE domain-containing protein [Anaerolineales bacterium]